MSQHKVICPDFGGSWSWDGELTPETKIIVADGSETLFSHIISRTNGDALEWWLNQGNENTV